MSTAEWRFKAECRQHDPEMWFPVGRIDGVARGVIAAEALRICITKCPVRPACAEFALRTGKAIGIWGGYDLGDNSVRTRLSKRDREALTEIAKGVKA